MIFNEFLTSISYLKSRKRGFYSTDPVMLTWRGADVARGTTARMRRGTEATWQGREWLTRGTGGAQGADTWQEATRVHTDARVGRHVAGRLVGEGPTG